MRTLKEIKQHLASLPVKAPLPKTPIDQEDAFVWIKRADNGKLMPGLYTMNTCKYIKWLSHAEVEAAIEMGILFVEDELTDQHLAQLSPHTINRIQQSTKPVTKRYY